MRYGTHKGENANCGGYTIHIVSPMVGCQNVMRVLGPLPLRAPHFPSVAGETGRT